MGAGRRAAHRDAEQRQSRPSLRYSFPNFGQGGSADSSLPLAGMVTRWRLEWVARWRLEQGLGTSGVKPQQTFLTFAALRDEFYFSVWIVGKGLVVNGGRNFHGDEWKMAAQFVREIQRGRVIVGASDAMPVLVLPAASPRRIEKRGAETAISEPC